MTSLFCSLACIPRPASIYEISDSSNTNVNKSLSPSLFYKKIQTCFNSFQTELMNELQVGFMFLVYFYFIFFRYPKEQTYFVYLSFPSNTLHTRTQLICIFYFICWRQRWYKKFRLKQTVWLAYSINLCICCAIQLTRFNSIY